MDEEGNLDPGLTDRSSEHYLMNFAIRNPKSWLKFLTGQANYQKIFGAMVSLTRRRFGPEQAPAPGWLQFRKDLDIIVQRGLRAVFISSQGDHRLYNLRQAGGGRLRELCSQGKVELVTIPRTDHTFSSLRDQERLLEVVRSKASEILGGTVKNGGVDSATELDIARFRTLHLH
jgi:hypothetical protein